MDNLFLSRVMQKTFLEVNEEGTEAAAVTGAVITLTSVPPPPIEVTIDRPFLCVIEDSESGLILFAGTIHDPASAGPVE
jgi:serpin B